MKIRTGFVSNSSSSSFVISVKKGGDAKFKLALVYDARENGHTIRTEEELKSYAREEWYEWETDEHSVERFNAWLKEIKAGREVIICHVSNDDEDTVSNAIYSGGTGVLTPIGKDAKIIEETEG